MLVMTPYGLWCPAADVYIDPVRAVDRAVITHGHSDHARRGMRSYLCHADTVPILQHRLGGKVSTQGVAYGDDVVINGHSDCATIMRGDSYRFYTTGVELRALTCVVDHNHGWESWKDKIYRKVIFVRFFIN